MQDDIVFGKYYPNKSKIHDLSPFVKVFCLFCFLLIELFCFDVKLCFLILIFTEIMVELSGIHPKIYLDTVHTLRYPIILFLVGCTCLSIDFNTIMISIFRLISVVLYLDVFTFTTTPVEIIEGFKKFLKPLKFFLPTEKIAFSIGLSIRFFPLLVEEKEIIKKTQASRGVDYDSSNLKNKIMARISIRKPMYHNTFDKIDKIARAMQIRLYEPNGNRTSFREKKNSIYNNLFIIVHILILMAVIGSEFIWHGI